MLPLASSMEWGVTVDLAIAAALGVGFGFSLERAGKFGLTLTEQATGRSVRVVPRAQAQLASRETPFFKAYRTKGIPASRVPDDVVDPLIAQVMNAPEERILSVGDEFRAEVRPTREIFAADVCEACGELVIEPYLRIDGERMVCIPCLERRAHGASVKAAQDVA